MKDYLRRLIEQITWLAVCIYHEGRGEPRRGQVGIGHVIITRVAKKDMSVRDIVFKPWQFSWANIQVIEGKPLPPVKDYKALMACMLSAMICLIERLEGKDMLEADHYYNPDKASPSWASSMTVIEKIGNHLFLKS